MPAVWLVEGRGEIEEVKCRPQDSAQIKADFPQTGWDSRTHRKLGQEGLWTFLVRCFTDVSMEMLLGNLP